MTVTKTILIADDDFFVRGQAKIALQGLMEVIEVDSGDLILDLYKKHKPTMVLLDIHMPKRDGKEVLAEILAHDPNAYVIMVSADAQAQNIQTTRFGGAKGFVAKPFTKDSLLKYVLACPALQG